ncbi:mitochondrial Homoaconitase, partial [Serendipita sp. 405]
MAARVSKESLEHESTADSGHSLFFYGTLLHPAVLKRVLGHEGNGLRHQPALLDVRRSTPLWVSAFAAILPWDEAKELFDGTSEPHLEERNVRGSLVTGFSKLDVELLDIFEGDEYERRLVSVNPLADSQPLSVAAADAGVLFDPISNPWVTASVKAHTYVWVKPAKLTLDPAIWSYDTFVRDNLHQWIGSDASRESYTEVDRRRDANNQSI